MTTIKYLQLNNKTQINKAKEKTKQSKIICKNRKYLEEE